MKIEIERNHYYICWECYKEHSDRRCPRCGCTEYSYNTESEDRLPTTNLWKYNGD